MTVKDWLGEGNKLGLDIWEKKYQQYIPSLKRKETFDEWLDRISNKDEAVKQLIIDKKFLFGGRILANRGMNKEGKKITYSNCYVLATDDSLEDIYKTAYQLARTYSYGGGVGIDISPLRPKDSKVNNAAKSTTGPLSFAELFDKTTEIIGQEGRRGALMLSMSCEHPDIEEFIKVKEDLNKITHANMSVRMTDKFLRDAERQRLHINTFKTNSGAGNQKIEKHIDAAAIVDTIAKCNWDMGEPGMLFWDNIEHYNLLNNNPDFKYAGTNPCVSGDTLILTDTGYVEIKDLCDKEVNIWNGFEFSTAIPHITGHDQNMLLISTSDGMELNCTEYHKFILASNDRIEAKNLKIGDKLLKCDFPIIDSGVEHDRKDMYTLGFFAGDGTYHNKANTQPLIYLYGNKKQLLNEFNYKAIREDKITNTTTRLVLSLNGTPSKVFVPDTSYSISDRLAWLSGLIDADGTISGDSNIQITSTNKEFLCKVKYLLNTVGTNCKISLSRKAGAHRLPDGNGTKKEYICKATYRLAICSYDLKILDKLGLNTKRIKYRITNRDASRFITITDIIPNGICDTVYCFNEPKNHSGIFNGIITAQCAEEPLPEGGSCLLASMNLAAFVKDSNFDFEDFSSAVKIAVGALNEVLFEGLPLHPLEIQRECVNNWRQIGLGIMGLADCLIKLNEKYGSDLSILTCKQIGDVLANSAAQKSAELVEQYGLYPMCADINSPESPIYSEFAKNVFNDETIELIKKYGGLANSQLLTIAPTGTLSTMLGISGGIEPLFANYYERTTKSLHGEDVIYKVYTPIVKEYMDNFEITSDENLPEYFITAREIDPLDRVIMQSIWQQYIDASISSTVNLPEDVSIEDIKDIYMEAWKRGLKGITVFRENCKRTAILNTSTSKVSTENEPQEVDLDASMTLIGKRKKLQTGCGSLHVLAYFNPQTKRLQEIYLAKGSQGGCSNFMCGLSRTISLLCRSGVDIYTIKDQLDSTGNCPSYAVRTATKHDTSRGSCCPMAVGNALVEMYEEFKKETTPIKIVTQTKETVFNDEKQICPECGAELRHMGGCDSCPNCGWSHCG